MEVSYSIYSTVANCFFIIILKVISFQASLSSLHAETQFQQLHDAFWTCKH